MIHFVLVTKYNLLRIFYKCIDTLFLNLVAKGTIKNEKNQKMLCHIFKHKFKNKIFKTTSQSQSQCYDINEELSIELPNENLFKLKASSLFKNIFKDLE